MSTYVQADRSMTVTTPLGADVLLLVGCYGTEGLSSLFSFQLDVIAENRREISFDKLLGQKVTASLSLDAESQRYFSGICGRVSQGSRDSDFTAYRLEIVPQLWLLTRKAQSRIFQRLSVPDILKKVFDGLDVSYKLQGTFEPRDFCVQYRETDFNFASRIMEEEGIYYFFTHSAGGSKMVVANTPQGHPDMPEHSSIIFEGVHGGPRDEDRIHAWEKIQELRPGKYTLWDHCFELPHKHLEAEKNLLDSVEAGSVTHKLRVPPSEKLEVYDYPGEYAQRFDGVDKGGGDQPAELQKIFQDNERTVGIRIQQEAVPALVIRGRSDCRHFVSGHKFTLERHFNGNGQYVVTGVQHSASVAGDYRTGEGGELTYENTFTCIPFSLPFRPLRNTPKPFVQGTQTAVVVGPPGEEIYPDKYGRVKVQFHWDREGKNDLDSSCWIRVGTMWAGKQWGMIHIPRIGQEVIVDFLEGDPDQPIIVGSVYNAEMMPPYALPDNKTQSGIKSRSSMGGGPPNFNEFRFEDKKGSEEVYLHAEKDWTIMVENDKNQTVCRDETHTVKRDRTKTVRNNEQSTIIHNRTEKVGDFETITIGKDRKLSVIENQTITVGQNETYTVQQKKRQSIGDEYTLAATNKIQESSKVIEITAGTTLTIQGPGGGMKIDSSGVTIWGVLVKIN
jgi:type VI secretion system secreted protein VgrG